MIKPKFTIEILPTDDGNDSYRIRVIRHRDDGGESISVYVAQGWEKSLMEAKSMVEDFLKEDGEL